MVTIIARFKMQAGKEEEALESAKKMGESVKAEEPGTLAYLVHRSIDDPSEIVYVEVYADDAAFQAHTQTPHMGELRARFAELYDPSVIKLERFERVGGFARPEAG
jgi:quinol monooxygenase YgiN